MISTLTSGYDGDFLEPPERTRLYQYATNRPGGVVVSDPELLPDWIQDA